MHRWISIHPPRAGRDGCRRWSDGTTDISIHPPRAGRDGIAVLPCFSASGFQSTRPVRGGTACRSWHPLPPAYFNPPAPCGAGRILRSLLKNLHYFNPPAPCGAGLHCLETLLHLLDFNPPAPCGAGQQSCTKFTLCILAQYTIQRAAKLLFAYQQAYFGQLYVHLPPVRLFFGANLWDLS